jgi:pyrimidine operon attenuation protein/uracil phosphoribosyltransferase
MAETYSEKKVIMNKEEISRTVKRLAVEIVEKNFGVKDIVIIGLQTRGVHLARRIINEMVAAKLIQSADDVAFGKLDITLYRDDISTISTTPLIRETEIPFDITDKKIILVDDVIFTGRSIRAAMDELMDFGRPQSIQLAVFVDRGHRELPIEPNFTGKKFITMREELIAVELDEVDGTDRIVLKTTKSGDANVQS